MPHFHLWQTALAVQELPHGLPLTQCGFLVFGVWFVAQTGTQERLTRVTGHTSCLALHSVIVCY
jgi:hypothetical protein